MIVLEMLQFLLEDHALWLQDLLELSQQFCSSYRLNGPRDVFYYQDDTGNLRNCAVRTRDNRRMSVFNSTPRH
jgi:hypothetical protein